jgi:hypothetical protein
MEKMNEEISKAAEVLDLPLEEVKEKFASIVTQHSLNLENESDKNLAIGLFRQWFGQQRRQQQVGTKPQQQSSFGGNGFGIVIGVEDARDMMVYQRTQVEGEYRRDSDLVYQEGKVAVVVQTDSGYQISQWLNNEEQTRNKDSEWKLPESAIEIEDTWIIPVDNRPAFASGDKNRKYGQPLPLEEFRRRVHFIGEGHDSPGGVKHWTLGLKDTIAINFSVETFRFCHIFGKWNPDIGTMWGIKNQTTVTYNDELDENHDNYQDTTNVDVQDLLGDVMGDYIVPLIDLERRHQETAALPLADKLVITDGVVTNMNLRQSSTGNRTLFISDLNADFNYEGEEYFSTACWVPPHLEIDFGIGSHVILVGRTSQREVDGELTSVSLNTFGIYVVDKRGQPLEYEDADEDDGDWF